MIVLCFSKPHSFKKHFFLILVLVLIFTPGNFYTIHSQVFGMSATVNLESLQKQIRNKEALLTGILLQFGVLPFLGFAVVKALDLSSPMGITLLVLTSSPGGSYSNWYDIQCCSFCCLELMENPKCSLSLLSMFFLLGGVVCLTRIWHSLSL